MQGTEARELAESMRLSILHYVQDPVSVRAYVGATAVLAALVTIGWHTRVTSALLWLAMMSIYHRMIPTNCGPDNVLMLWLFYLMLSPSGAAYSLDARRVASRRGTMAEPLIEPWAQRLIQLHLCLIYFDTAVIKCAGRTWLGGTALHFVLFNQEFGRADLTALANYPILISGLTHFALFAEFALPFLLWFRVCRPLTMATGLGLHFSILFLINVPLFGELMTAAYLTFLTPPELDTLLSWVDPRNRYRRVARWLRAVLPVSGPGSVIEPVPAPAAAKILA
jgi:hypothetical protein